MKLFHTSFQMHAWSFHVIWSQCLKHTLTASLSSNWTFNIIETIKNVDVNNIFVCSHVMTLRVGNDNPPSCIFMMTSCAQEPHVMWLHTFPPPPISSSVTLIQSLIKSKYTNITYGSTTPALGKLLITGCMCKQCHIKFMHIRMNCPQVESFHAIS